MSGDRRLGSAAAHVGHVSGSQDRARPRSHASTGWLCLSGKPGAPPAETGRQRGRPRASWNGSFHRHHTPGFSGCPHTSGSIESAHPSAGSSLGAGEVSHLFFIFQVLTSFFSRAFSPHFSGCKGLQLLYLAMIVFKKNKRESKAACSYSENVSKLLIVLSLGKITQTSPNCCLSICKIKN